MGGAAAGLHPISIFDSLELSRPSRLGVKAVCPMLYLLPPAGVKMICGWATYVPRIVRWSVLKMGGGGLVAGSATPRKPS